MLKILRARLQQYMNLELPDVQVGFRKGRGTKDQIANIHWIIKEAKEFQKNIYFCFTNYTKAFDCGSQQTAENSSLYAGQEATVRNGHETTDWSQIRKGVCQSCILSPCLFNLYAEYIMWMKQKLESRLPGEISITSDTRMTPPLWQKAKEN